jgi:hypothetical protein
MTAGPAEKLNIRFTMRLTFLVTFSSAVLQPNLYFTGAVPSQEDSPPRSVRSVAFLASAESAIDSAFITAANGQGAASIESARKMPCKSMSPQLSHPRRQAFFRRNRRIK